MEQNNNNKHSNKNTKVSEIAKIYAVVTQGFFMMLTTTLGGFLIGRYAIKQDVWAAILALIGALIGLVIFLTLLFKLKIGGDSHERQ